MEYQSKLPEFSEDIGLREAELTRFAEMVIWPAADFFYEGHFIQEATETRDWGEDKFFISPEGEQGIMISFFCHTDSLVIPNQEEADIHRAFIYLGILRKDLQPSLPPSDQECNIWELRRYDFSTSPSMENIIMHYYELYKHDEEDDSLDFIDEEDMHPKTETMIEKLNSEIEKNKERTFTKQHCLEIYNSLLTLGVPDDKLNFQQWLDSL